MPPERKTGLAQVTGHAGAPEVGRPPSGRDTSTLAYVLAAVFLVLLLINILCHEMWRDELKPWSIAIGSSSIADLLHNTEYTGHPPLWYLCLYALSRFSDQPFAMQVLHLLIATAVVYVFTRFSPFTRLEKLLFAFGYFPSFEYGVISRSYALGLLFVFVSCAIFSSTKRAYVGLACVLVLLAQTSMMGMILAVSFGLAWGFDSVLAVRAGASPHLRKWQVVCAILILVVGIAGSIAQIVPPEDRGGDVGWKTDVNIGELALATMTYWRSYIPIPELTYHFWGTNILDHVWWPSEALLSVPLALLSVLLVIRHPAALLLWVCGSAGLLAFWYAMYYGALRHHGHLFVLLLAACWISTSCQAWTIRWPVIDKLARMLERHRSQLIGGLLTVHVLAGAFASVMDLALPFSASQEVARFIDRHYPGDVWIVGDRDYAASAVAGHLSRPIYYPSSQRFGTFAIWDNKRKKVGLEDLNAQVRELLSIAKKDILLVLNYELSAPMEGLALVRKFERSIVLSEMFYLYVAKYGATGASP